MSLRKQTLERFKVLFPGVNLTKVKLHAIADKVDKVAIDDEAKIDEALKALNEAGLMTFAEIAKEDDRVRVEAVKAVKKPEDGNQKQDEKKDDEIPADIPENLKGFFSNLTKSLGILSTEVSELRAEKSQSSIQSKIAESLKDTGIPGAFYGRWKMPEKPEEIEAFIEDVKTSHKELFPDFKPGAQQQQQQNTKLGVPPKTGGTQTGGENKPLTKEQTADIVKTMM